MMLSTGLGQIEEHALSLNRYLTTRLIERGFDVLSPISDEQHRSAETLVKAKNPAQVVSALAAKKIYVTEKPEGFRVATDFFNNEQDIDALIEALLVVGS